MPKKTYSAYFPRNVSTTIDPFRDISLDLAPRGKPGMRAILCAYASTNMSMLLYVTYAYKFKLYAHLISRSCFRNLKRVHICLCVDTLKNTYVNI